MHFWRPKGGTMTQCSPSNYALGRTVAQLVEKLEAKPEKGTLRELV